MFKKRAVRHHVSLLLLEIHPRTNNAEKALNYIINAGYYLESFLGQDVLHHFGNGIFGFIEENADEDQAKYSEKIYLADADVRVFNAFI